MRVCALSNRVLRAASQLFKLKLLLASHRHHVLDFKLGSFSFTDEVCQAGIHSGSFSFIQNCHLMTLSWP